MSYLDNELSAQEIPIVEAQFKLMLEEQRQLKRLDILRERFPVHEIL